MTPERATGIILRTRPLTDTSLIVHWLTAEMGRLATVAKGARRPKSPFRGQLDLFYLAEFSFQRSPRSDLHNLREVKLNDTFPALRQDLSLLRQAANCANLIEQNTESEAPMPQLFTQFSGLVRELPRHPASPQTIFAFEMRMLGELGLTPNLADASLSPGSKQVLVRLTEAEWPAVFRLRLSDEQRAEIGQFLQRFLVFHLGKIPPSRFG